MSQKRKPVNVSKLIPVWVHKPGLKGYDICGDPIEEMELHQYGYVTKVVNGTQPADTDPHQLKTYNTHQMKAEGMTNG